MNDDVIEIDIDTEDTPKDDYDSRTLDEVIERHKNINNEREKMSDVIVTQCILCVLIAAAIIILNIAKPDVSSMLVEKYKACTGADTEEIIVDVIKKINDFIC